MGHVARECSPTDHADFHRNHAGCFIKKHETRRSPTDQRKVFAPMRTDGSFHGFFTLAPLPIAWGSMRRRRNGSTNKHRCHSGCFYQKHEYLSWHAPFSPSHAPSLCVNVVLKRRKPACIFAPHSFLYYKHQVRQKQLSYQQRTCVHNAFDDIMEYTIECDDPLETKGIAADIKRR